MSKPTDGRTGCAGDEGGFTTTLSNVVNAIIRIPTCGVLGRVKEPEKDAMNNTACLGVVAAWISAREAGDVGGATAHIHPDFVFTSQHVIIRGKDAARDKLFAQKAPIPSMVLQPLQFAIYQRHPDRPMLYREIEFTSGTTKAAVRQEWELEWTPTNLTAGITSSAPLIVKLTTSHVATEPATIM